MQRRFDLVVFDLDGVVYLGEQVLPYAKEVIAQLESDGVAVRYLTNSSAQSSRALVKRLEKLGIAARQEQIYTSGYLTGLYLKGLKRKSKRIFVISEGGMRKQFEELGLHVVEQPPADYVALGIDFHFTYERLEQAFQCYLQGATLVASNKDRTFPTDHGERPGGGSLVAAVEYACGTRAKVIGKPSPSALRLVAEEAGVALERTLLVGDRLDTDVACARRARAFAALVLTGIATKAEAERLPERLRPHWILESLADLPPLVWPKQQAKAL